MRLADLLAAVAFRLARDRAGVDHDPVGGFRGGRELVPPRARFRRHQFDFGFIHAAADQVKENSHVLTTDYTEKIHGLLDKIKLLFELSV